MPIKKILIIITLIASFLTSNTFADEIDMAANEALFNKMFGEEYNKIVTSSSKIDDEKFALDLITNANALNSKPDFQIFIKLKSARLLIDSDKNKKPI